MIKEINLFPYSNTDNKTRWCKYSGDGDVHCTESIRKRKEKICLGCSQNPDIKNGLLKFKSREKRKKERIEN